jgi:hypothetical protein
MILAELVTQFTDRLHLLQQPHLLRLELGKQLYLPDTAFPQCG